MERATPWKENTPRGDCVANETMEWASAAAELAKNKEVQTRQHAGKMRIGPDEERDSMELDGTERDD